MYTFHNLNPTTKKIKETNDEHFHLPSHERIASAIHHDGGLCRCPNHAHSHEESSRNCVSNYQNNYHENYHNHSCRTCPSACHNNYHNYYNYHYPGSASSIDFPNSESLLAGSNAPVLHGPRRGGQQEQR